MTRFSTSLAALALAYGEFVRNRRPHEGVVLFRGALAELWKVDPHELAQLLNSPAPRAVEVQVLALITIEAYAVARLAEMLHTFGSASRDWEQLMRLVRRFANDTLNAPSEGTTLGQYSDFLEDRLMRMLENNSICSKRPQA